TFSVFIGYYILVPYFSEYSLTVLGITAIIILISHHIYAYIFNLYHRAWEYASVRELISITQSVTATMMTSFLLIFMLFNITFFRLTLLTWMMHLILIGGSRMAWKVINHQLNGKRSNGSSMTRTLVVGGGKG